MRYTFATLVLLTCCAAALAQPTVIGDIEPHPVFAGRTALVTLRAAEPGWEITAAKVSVREEPSVQASLNDSGASGDEMAGDGIWSIAVPVPSDASATTYHLVFEAELRGAQTTRTATTTVDVVVASGVTIVSPKPQERIAGQVAVKADLSAPASAGIISCRIGASDLTPMTRQADGSWTASVDVTDVDNGLQPLTVCASGSDPAQTGEERADPAAGIGPGSSWCAHQTVIVANPYVYCWGDLHAHTSYSDGVLTPRDAYTHARDVSRLDFFAVTDHGEALGAEEMADVIAQAEAVNEDGKFVALYGVEWTKGIGHINYFMEPDHNLSLALPGFWRQVSEMGALAHLNHPGINNFNNLAYDADADAAIFGVETRNENEELAYIGLLNNGWHLSPTGCQDKHDATWGEGPHWTVALARSRTRAGILEALASRRVYSSYDRNMRLALSIDDRDMGSRLSGPATDYTVTVSVNDPDTQDATSLIQVYLYGKVAREIDADAATYTGTAGLALEPGRHYVFVKVTQADGDKAWSAPIWLYLYPTQ
ncbi:MAG: CehA/McbA family metallohydrolase [Armatimonadota bacterium]|nr:MAG: CehA/McbA family metallohydrolase [Armatimonadota bacterium]